MGHFVLVVKLPLCEISFMDREFIPELSLVQSSLVPYIYHCEILSVPWQRVPGLVVVSGDL